MVSAGLDNAEAEIARAKRAAAFMEEGGVFAEAWAELDARIVAQWRAANDPVARETLHSLQRAMTGLRNILDGYVENGAVSLHRLHAEERAKAAYTQFPA